MKQNKQRRRQQKNNLVQVSVFRRKGLNFITTLKRKMKRCFKEDVKFITLYNTKKMAMFCSPKDKIKTIQKANL